GGDGGRHRAGDAERSAAAPGRRSRPRAAGSGRDAARRDPRRRRPGRRAVADGGVHDERSRARSREAPPGAPVQSRKRRMIREVAVSAPGKTILMGEHAAVYGHPALVAALDLRMTVAVRTHSGAGVRLDMPALGWVGEVSWEELLALAEARRSRWTDAF